VTTNLRVSLTILSIGFAIEGVGELASFASEGRFRPGVNLLFVLPTVMTVAGLLFVWIGRHEWSELHRDRVRQAHRVFGLSLVGAAIAGVLVGLLVLVPAVGVPVWAEAVFGVALGSLVFGTFVTYVYLVFHLVGRTSRFALATTLLWTVAVSALIGSALGGNLPTIVHLVESRRTAVPGFIDPVTSLSSYLFVSYFLLLAAYVDAHRHVAAGPTPARPARPDAAGPS